MARLVGGEGELFELLDNFEGAVEIDAGMSNELISGLDVVDFQGEALVEAELFIQDEFGGLGTEL